MFIEHRLTIVALIFIFEGWLVNAQWLDSGVYSYPKCEVSKTRHDKSGEFNFHNQYLPNDMCIFIMPSEKGSHLTVSFLRFNFGFEDEHGNCTNFVEIGSGPMADSNKRYCGTRVPQPYISQTGDAWIWIHTDTNYIFDSDISIHYSTVSDCGGDFVVPLHTFVTSPGYPNSAPAHSECQWSVTLLEASSDTPMQIQLNYWQVNYNTTFEIYDGLDKNSKRMVSFDENTPSVVATSKVIMTSGPYAYIVFRRGQYYPGAMARFNATIKRKGYCLPGTFSCSDGESCYSREGRCDGRQDCSTGYDEQGCGGCPPKEFWCGSHDHNCYTLSEKCNGQKNCQTNMEDEVNCKSCGPGSFLCAADHRCIFDRWRCDGDFDCSDSSDEEGCSYSASRRVITAAIIGSLICCLLLVIALGCTCKLYSLRASHHRHPHHHYRATPLTRVEREIFQRQAPPTYDMTIDGVGADPPLQSTRPQRQRRHRNQRYQFERAMPATTEQAAGNQRDEGMEVRTLPPPAQQAAGGAEASALPQTATTPAAQQNANLKQSVASFMFESVPDILAEMIFASRQSQAETPGQAAVTPASTLTRSSTLPIETRDSGTQTNPGVRNVSAGAPAVASTSSTSARASSSSRRRSGRSSSGNRSRSRRSSRGATASANTNSREQQAKPLPKKKKIMPVMVPAPCSDGIVEDTLTCVYPCPPSYSQAVASSGPGGPVLDASSDSNVPAAEMSSSSLGSSFEDPGVSSPGLVDSVFTPSPKSSTKSKFSLSFSIGQAIRTIATSPFSKFQRNPYVQMENPGMSPTIVSTEDEIGNDGQMHMHSRQKRSSETSSDEDLIDCSARAEAFAADGNVSTIAATEPELEGSSVKIFPQNQGNTNGATSVSPPLHRDTDSVELADFSLSEDV